MGLIKINKPRTAAIQLARSAHPITPEVALWVAIRNSCRQLDFRVYKNFIDDVMTIGSMRRKDLGAAKPTDVHDLNADDRTLNEYRTVIGNDALRIDANGDAQYALLPFSNSDRYALLKAATEVFVMAKCGVDLNVTDFQHIINRVSRDVEVAGNGIDFSQITPALWKGYLDHVDLPGNNILPYYGLILDKLKDVQIDPVAGQREMTAGAYRILRQKLTNPTFLELIWSYWHEEGMLMQTSTRSSCASRTCAPRSAIRSR